MLFLTFFSARSKTKKRKTNFPLSLLKVLLLNQKTQKQLTPPPSAVLRLVQIFPTWTFCLLGWTLKISRRVFVLQDVLNVRNNDFTPTERSSGKFYTETVAGRNERTNSCLFACRGNTEGSNSRWWAFTRSAAKFHVLILQEGHVDWYMLQRTVTSAKGCKQYTQNPEKNILLMIRDNRRGWKFYKNNRRARKGEKPESQPMQSQWLAWTRE